MTTWKKRLGTAVLALAMSLMVNPLAASAEDDPNTQEPQATQDVMEEELPEENEAETEAEDEETDTAESDSIEEEATTEEENSEPTEDEPSTLFGIPGNSITPSTTFTRESLLGEANYFGLTSEALIIKGHSETNFATGTVYFGEGFNGPKNAQYNSDFLMGDYQKTYPGLENISPGHFKVGKGEGTTSDIYFYAPPEALDRLLEVSQNFVGKKDDNTYYPKDAGVVLDTSLGKEEIQTKVTEMINKTKQQSQALANEPGHIQFDDIAERNNEWTTVNLQPYGAGTYVIDVPAELMENTPQSNSPLFSEGRLNLLMNDDQYIIFNVVGNATKKTAGEYGCTLLTEEQKNRKTIPIGQYKVNGTATDSGNNDPVHFASLHVTFNFPTQDSITVTGTFAGTIVAPNAVIYNGNVDAGQFLADTIVLPGNEFHFTTELEDGPITEAEIRFNKTIDGKPLPSDCADTFTFEIYNLSVDNNVYTKGSLLKTTTTKPSGNLFFNTQFFKDAGEAWYLIEETNIPEGYTPTNPYIAVKVTVTKNTTTLVATPSYYSAALNDDGTYRIEGDLAAPIINNGLGEKTSVHVKKEWDDSNNNDGKRPGSISVNLLADGKQINSIVLNTANNWEHTFSNLDKYSENGNKIIYTVVETGLSNDYKLTLSGNAETGFLLTNSHDNETTNIPVTKVWNDTGNEEKRPASITVNLLADGTNVDSADLSDANSWTHTFTGLNVYKNGKEIVYTVEEITVNGYSPAVITGDAKSGFTVTNNLIKKETTDISVTKDWQDNKNNDGKRPTSVTINLLADGKPTGKNVVLSESNSWTATFNDLEKEKDGQTIAYTVEEVKVNDYTVEITGNAENGFTITNTHKDETIDIPVMKDWQDNKNNDGKRPDSITVNLPADGKKVDSFELSDANNWEHTFEKLKVYNNKQKINYTVEEIKVTDYDVIITGNAENGFTITNTHDDETTNIPVKKDWQDNKNNDGKRPASITVNLLADGTKVDSVVLNDANSWEHTFSGLKVYNDKQKISYTVEEENVDGYSPSISGDADKGFTITNTHENETTSISVAKKWDDRGNQDNLRPAKVTVILLADGKKLMSRELSANTNWRVNFSGLPKYANGKEIIYTVQEENVKGYSCKVTGNAKDGFVLINSHTPEEKKPTKPTVPNTSTK